MNKQELIDRINKSTLIEKKLVGNVLDCLSDIVAEELENGGEVTLPGLGKLYVADVAERPGRNPATGEEITIAARKAPKFKAAKALKDVVNGN